MNKRISLLSTVFLCLLVCVITYVATASAKYNEYEQKVNDLYSHFDEFNKLIDIDNYVRNQFIGEYDKDAIVESLLNGYFAGLGDPFSMYHTKEEMDALLMQSDGNMQGIGVYTIMNIDNGYIYITQVMKDSPAFKSGIVAGDQIKSVEGVELTAENYSERINLIKGETGTSVTLGILHSDGSEEEIAVEREQFRTQSVFLEYIEQQSFVYAKITIVEFSGNVNTDFKAAMEQTKERGVDGYIFDVRSNPGGDLDIICDVLNSILPEGPIVHIKDAKGEIVSEKNSAGKTPLDKPAVVLINGETASAGELFTAALKDYDVATLIGTQTFGKGTMQHIITLPDGSGFRISVNYYDPPKSGNYHDVGIEPDIVVELDEYYNERRYLLNIDNDDQLKAAVEYLNKTIEGEN